MKVRRKNNITYIIYACICLIMLVLSSLSIAYLLTGYPFKDKDNEVFYLNINCSLISENNTIKISINNDYNLTKYKIRINNETWQYSFVCKDINITERIVTYIIPANITAEEIYTIKFFNISTETIDWEKQIVCK